MSILKRFLNLTGVFALAVTLSCASVPTCEHKVTIRHDTSILPRDSFVKVLVKVDDRLYSTGSGVLIKHIDKSSYILTAGHMCESDRKISVLDIDEKEYQTIALAKAAEYDLCVLVTEGVIPREVASLAKANPKLGDKVYNLAAPKGIFSKNMVLHLQGYYSGEISVPIEKHPLSTYTIPSAGGSSGSPVFNEAGQVVGIISMKFQGFENVTLAVKHIDLQRMIGPLLVNDPLKMVIEMAKVTK